MKFFKYLVILGSLLMMACQTNMVKEFDSLKVGYDKHQVLDKLGSPRGMTRINGEDRWYYMYYNDDVRLQKEVHFKDGMVIYFGDKKAPSADLVPEAIDAKNEKLNKELDAANEARAEASKNAYLDYVKYEKKVKKQDRVDYLPEFEPVQ